MNRQYQQAKSSTSRCGVGDLVIVGVSTPNERTRTTWANEHPVAIVAWANAFGCNPLFAGTIKISGRYTHISTLTDQSLTSATLVRSCCVRAFARCGSTLIHYQQPKPLTPLSNVFDYACLLLLVFVCSLSLDQRSLTITVVDVLNIHTKRRPFGSPLGAVFQDFPWCQLYEVRPKFACIFT